MATARPIFILLLEDEILISMVLASYVESQGYTVVGPAKTCEAAISIIEIHPIDAAILDFMVDDKNCGEVIRILNLRGIPWALSSAIHIDDLPQLYRSKWSLPKPTVEDDVSIILDEMLRSKATGSSE